MVRSYQTTAGKIKWSQAYLIYRDGTVTSAAGSLYGSFIQCIHGIVPPLLAALENRRKIYKHTCRYLVTPTYAPSKTSSNYGVLGFDSQRGLGIFLFTTASRTALGSTQPPIQWVPGALSLGLKRPGREDDHSPPSSAEVKECVELYLHSPNTSTWRGA
jgi:hypothetical protein